MLTAQELQRRLDELEAAGGRQVQANMPPPRDLSGLDMRAMQAQQNLGTPTARFAPAPQQMPPQVPTAAFPPVPPPAARMATQGGMGAMQGAGMPPRDLSGLRMPQRTAVRGY